MSGTTRNDSKGSQDPVEMETRQAKIMTLPLPQILDEREAVIRAAVML